MADPFDKAESWRLRAQELHALADDANEPVVRRSLLDIADSLEQHARHLEEVAVKVRGIRRHIREPGLAAFADAD
jgi:hypothetical protein